MVSAQPPPQANPFGSLASFRRSRLPLNPAPAHCFQAYSPAALALARKTGPRQALGSKIEICLLFSKRSHSAAGSRSYWLALLPDVSRILARQCQKSLEPRLPCLSLSALLAGRGRADPADQALARAGVLRETLRACPLAGRTTYSKVFITSRPLRLRIAGSSGLEPETLESLGCSSRPKPRPILQA